MRLRLKTRELDLSAPIVMGVLNVTPDSFSDGGRFLDIQNALTHARRMVAEGARILDVGGESTRPGAAAVSVSEELDRTIPVIERLKREVDVVLSIDTMKPEVMRAACSAGAELINDVMALRAPGALQTARDTGAAVCLMHMQGEPRTMQAAPHYGDVLAEVRTFLQERRNACLQAGIEPDQILLDPGICFGKTLAHNLRLLANLETLASLDQPLLVGVSRKSMFEKILGAPVEERLSGGLAVAALAVWQSAAIIRTHDVRATADAIQVAIRMKKERV